MKNPFNTLKTLKTRAGKTYKYYSLKELDKLGLAKIGRLPVSMRIILESVIRSCDGKKVKEEDIERLLNWDAKNPGDGEIPFVVSRIVLQDFTGVPLLVDLAAMRAAVAKVGKNPGIIEPIVPVDLVVDHSVQVDVYRSADAYSKNLEKEFERNYERYEFLKWGQQAFETFNVVPPGVGIVHQVNLEYLGKLVFEEKMKDGSALLYPDSLVGTDSHTTMINGLGIVGWGVGGIEAEAGMLGQPIYIKMPEVIGVCLKGKLREGVTATDLTLRLTELLREEKVVGKFVEYFGEGTRNLSVADRATIANMCPEYGATMAYFPIDEQSIEYMRATGRPEELLANIEEYYKTQGMWGVPDEGDVDYTKVIHLNLGDIHPCVAGPKRPQDRIEVRELKGKFSKLLSSGIKDGGYMKDVAEIEGSYAIGDNKYGDNPNLKHGSVVIAAITSCTNTSNPSVMIAAGLLAKKAVQRGLKVSSTVKTSLAPGSRVVTEYLDETGLQPYLDQLGFSLVGYGCTTCIGNSGPLDAPIESTIKEHDIIAASVLSGNRNFEARIHPTVKANFLMSPPLVVAYALAGTVDIDLETEALGVDKDGEDVYLKDIWPTDKEISENIKKGIRPQMFMGKYDNVDESSPDWSRIEVKGSELYKWNEDSTYIQHPPFFEGFSMHSRQIVDLNDMRPLAIFGDSVTTDHISPAGSFNEFGPAGKYLIAKGVAKKDFNSFGSRRGNDKVMTRGTFANVRIKNHMADGKEGGYTKLMPKGEVMAIFDACEEYKKENVPLIVFAGVDYGMGSSRDWAAKGTALLGVKAVVSKSFERIHRSNLVGMGILPLEFLDGQDAGSMKIDGTEVFSIKGLNKDLKAGQVVELWIQRQDGSVDKEKLRVRIDTDIEVEYYRHGGILPYVLRELLNQKS